MSKLSRLLLAAFLMNSLAGAALAAELIVEKDPPPHAKAHFFERVPCDSMMPGSFTDIRVTIDDKSLTRLRLTECGVEVNSQDVRS